jgi:hypothetical protein
MLSSGEQNLLLKEGKRGLRRTPKKMDFMRIKTDSCNLLNVCVSRLDLQKDAHEL